MKRSAINISIEKIILEQIKCDLLNIAFNALKIEIKIKIVGPCFLS